MSFATLKLNMICVFASSDNIHVDALTTDMAMLVERVPRQVQAFAMRDTCKALKCSSSSPSKLYPSEAILWDI